VQDRLRARAVIENEIVALAPSHSGDDDRMPAGPEAPLAEFRRSARQALRWLLVGGDVGAGPVSAQAVVAALGRAEEVIYARSSRSLDVARAWSAARVDVGAVRHRDATVAMARPRSLIRVDANQILIRRSR
jgi:hypothetical protein